MYWVNTTNFLSSNVTHGKDLFDKVSSTDPTDSQLGIEYSQFLLAKNDSFIQLYFYGDSATGLVENIGLEMSNSTKVYSASTTEQALIDNTLQILNLDITDQPTSNSTNYIIGLNTSHTWQNDPTINNM